MNKPTLWVMCGLSGSGKSSVATQIVGNIKILVNNYYIKGESCTTKITR